MSYIHIFPEHSRCECCNCGECETRRTMEISPSTAAHIKGEFDVDKARAEVQLKQADDPDNWSGLER